MSGDSDMRSLKPPLSRGGGPALFGPLPPVSPEVELIEECFGVEHVLDFWSWLSPAGTDLVK